MSQQPQSQDFVEQMESEQGLPDAWITKDANEGDLVMGRITRITEGWSDESNSYYPILVINDEISGTPKSVHCFFVALQNQLSRLEPEIGDRIGIKLGPKIPLKNNPNRSVQTFTTKIEGKGEKVNWNRYRQRRGERPAEVEAAASTPADDDIPF